MPLVKKGETRNSYLSRAIPEMMQEGLDQKAAVGKASGMYDEKWQGPKKKGFQKAVKK